MGSITTVYIGIEKAFENGKIRLEIYVDYCIITENAMC